MINTSRAHGRVGFLGNPSDIYGGKCISFTFNNYAEVRIDDSSIFEIGGHDGADNNLVYNGSNDLIKATLNHIGLVNHPMRISYHTNIPIGSGLSGSSAIIVATLKSLNERFGLRMDKYQIAETALHIETDELKIAAGFQDRYVISFGGVCYMDFTGKEFMRPALVDGYGKLEQLVLDRIPCFLALGIQPKSSAIIHNPLREKFLKGTSEEQRAIKEDMDNIAELAVLGKEALLRGDWGYVGKLMITNTELRDKLGRHLGKSTMHLEKDKEMIEKAMSYGALGAKVAGSGGAVIVLTEDKTILDKMIREYPCFIPEIV